MELEPRIATLEDALLAENARADAMAGKIAALTTICLALIAHSSNHNSLRRHLERMKETTVARALGSRAEDATVDAAEKLLDAALAGLR